MQTNAVIEAMATSRAMRYLKPDPIPDELIESILFAATRASSPGNTQGWTFLVVKDAEQRRRIGDALLAVSGAVQSMTLPDDPSERRTLAGARHLVLSVGEAPVIVFVCGHNIYPPNAPNEKWMLSATYAASQNLIVAARSVGIGATFTTFQGRIDRELHAILGIPDDVYIATTIPLGWPARPFGPLNRKPLAEVVRYDHW
jgi:nitroreductase